MFFFFSKFLPVFVYPIGLTILLIVLAIFLWRWRRGQTAVLIVAAVLLLLASNQYVANALARPLEWQYLPPDPLPQADAIVVLGGMVRWADYPQPVPNLSESGDRLLYAAWLYQQGVADNLLLAGGRAPGATTTEAEEMRHALLIMGIPESALWYEDESVNTYENALFSKPILDAKGVNTIVLVTSATHMPRSMGIFAKMGYEVIPAPTDYYTVAPEWDEETRLTPSEALLYLLPSADALEITSRTLKEYIGILVYGWRGWL